MIVAPRGVAPGIDQQQMVDMRVEFVEFQPRFMVGPGTLRTQFLHENCIAQPLRAAKVARVAREAHGITGLSGLGQGVLHRVFLTSRR